ncbi:MAG: PDZ domain-containing protein [Pseudomonadota bacterium]|nr:PDZ domain-containing protein [Pseudomonadota bacterium]
MTSKQTYSSAQSSTQGYCRFPSVHGDMLVFICDDDLWTAPLTGGVARRLSTNLATVSSPRLSPDGELLAFTGCEEGSDEVYLMPATGGEVQRLTYQGQCGGVEVVGWSADGENIFYSSSAALPFGRWQWLWQVPVAGGEPQRLPFGPANHVAYAADKGMVIGRSTGEPARWKRYRGGTAGQLWLDVAGDGQFKLLAPVVGNLTTPMWVGKRIYFISDHEGVGNIYSCQPAGADVQRHTDHDTYYCRSASTDGKHIVYHAGADIYAYDIASDNDRRINIKLCSARTQRQRKFVEVERYLQEYALAPEGHALLLTVRGKPFTMANWEGAVSQHGERDGVRYRLTQWLNDGKRLVTISSVDGEEKLEIHTEDGGTSPQRLAELDIGHAVELAVCPYSDTRADSKDKDGSDKADAIDQLLITNERFELLHIDLATKKLSVLDQSEHYHISDVSWSPDGQWCAYAFHTALNKSAIKVCQLQTGATHCITNAEFQDFAPTWDTEGKFLYFLAGHRSFAAIHELMHHSVVPLSSQLMLVTLRKDVSNPFIPQPQPLVEEEKQDSDKTKDPVSIAIDFEGIAQRTLAFPCPPAHCQQLAALDSKVIWTEFPLSVHAVAEDNEEEAQGVLNVYDFTHLKQRTLVAAVESFQLASDRKTLAYQSKGRLRVIKAGEKPPEQEGEGNGDAAGRDTGWIDLARVKASVSPLAEWRQIYREAWCAQRDRFWTADMSGVDWQQVYKRYLPLLARVATRGELSDLLWEMQGELGTSHAYVMGGDYRDAPDYAQGCLGADFVYDATHAGYRVASIPCGDSWSKDKDSALNAAGADIKVGDILLAVGGQRVSQLVTPEHLLVNLAGQEVQVTFKCGDNTRVVTLKALRSDRELRYRAWVNRNRHYVHSKSEGKIGYVHIPHMMVAGFAEFERGFSAECHRAALLIDVRHNGGGYVSQYIFARLTQRVLGYDIRRWGAPISYPYPAAPAQMVAITDENSGSDGDVFSHCFKLLKLGKLIGKRTWGGVIGMDAGCEFVDGGRTTQPGYSCWFVDVGWGIENYGTDPDIEVDYRPQDYATGNDPQLDRGIAELMLQLETSPPQMPAFDQRPNLSLPRLPQ